MKAKIIGALICVAAAVACWGITSTPSKAGGCNSCYVAKPYIKEVIKEVPIAVPVLVPAFQFQYTPPCAAVPVVPAVGVAGIPVAQGPPMATYPGQQPQGYMPGYGQNNAAAAAPQGDARIRELAKALLEEMNRQANGPDDGPPAVPDGRGVPERPF